jgi:outer membrane receptor protein involved in Fe transport
VAGNPNLQPEKAVTVSGGIVLTPHWVEGLTLSADWYSINIHGSIFSTGYQSVLNRCGAGETIYCNQITLDGAGHATNINVFPLNAATESVSGLDFQANYTTPFLDGNVDLMAVGNYVDQQSRSALGITYDSAGALGGSPDSYASSQPKFRATLGATYNEGPWSVTAQTRLIGSARLSNGTQGQPGVVQASLNGAGALTTGTIMGVVDNNGLPFIAYMDLRGSYSFNDHFQVYGAMDNVGDKSPPIVATTQGGSGTNALVYDALGRTVRVGVRINY